jgi:hypothetical protein
VQCLYIKVPKSKNVNYNIKIFYNIKSVSESPRWKEGDVGGWFPVLRLTALK